MISKRLAELKGECLDRGIRLSGEVKYRREDYVDLLAHHTIQRLPFVPWGLTRRLYYKSPMLAFQFKNLKPSEQKEVLTSPKWGAEEKIDGNRIIIAFHPEEGFSFYSRNISVTDFLPICYTSKVLLIKDNQVYRPDQFIGVYPKSFVIDSEVTCSVACIDTVRYHKSSSGVITGAMQNAVTSILSHLPEVSHRIQMEQGSLLFKAFDVMEVDSKAVSKKPFWERRKILEKLVEVLSRKIPIKLLDLKLENKQRYFEEVVLAGGEGLVLKNLEYPYIPSVNRDRRGYVKLKRSMTGSLNADVDAYVSGFLPGNKGTNIENFVGALKLSTYLRQPNGGFIEHHIATVSGMPMEVRKRITEFRDGVPLLRKEFYGKVLQIDGQDVSSKNLRFSHATINWDVGFREDKNPEDCVLDEDFLKGQIL